jgi:hypothetical protein
MSIFSKELKKWIPPLLALSVDLTIKNTYLDVGAQPSARLIIACKSIINRAEGQRSYKPNYSTQMQLMGRQKQILKASSIIQC